ncbi:hypothetical protein Plim_3009 [Planctopirus limnophila DSM 3776]|uniref:Uncharacterized protein n=1 Tax=Planctopirus limnophila (strain ATCC 43296 / DSM 3776 / IFAM 1008 / Mu 290) TaxID=521674 RepID=D5SSA7_PLAL2|nr:hypothetical protein Plim_3009 [Planctopirus limnophila DSM 3776]
MHNFCVALISRVAGNWVAGVKRPRLPPGYWKMMTSDACHPCVSLNVNWMDLKTTPFRKAFRVVPPKRVPTQPKLSVMAGMRMARLLVVVKSHDNP